MGAEQKDHVTHGWSWGRWGSGEWKPQRQPKLLGKRNLQPREATYYPYYPRAPFLWICLAAKICHPHISTHSAPAYFQTWAKRWKLVVTQRHVSSWGWPRWHSPSCFSSYAINMCPFHSLFRTTFSWFCGWFHCLKLPQTSSSSAI